MGVTTAGSAPGRTGRREVTEDEGVAVPDLRDALLMSNSHCFSIASSVRL